MRPLTRLRCEALEARDVPATWTVTTPDELIARMTQVNNEAGGDTIVLSPGRTHTLTATNHSTHGATGQPVVESENGSLTIVGNGATVERSGAAGTPLPEKDSNLRLVG